MFLKRLWSTIFLIFHFSFANAIIKLYDDNHQLVTLSHPATRIISLAPHITELLYAIGAGANIVGVDQASDFPQQVRNITKVANFKYVNEEQVLALKPDLIITWQPPDSAALLDLRKLGIAIYYCNPQSLFEIASAMQKLGLLTGYTLQAQTISKQFLAKLENLKSVNNKQPPLPVFYAIWSHPLLTIGKNSLLGQVVNLCGGQLTLSSSNKLVSKIDIEQVILKDPTVIIINQQQDLSYWQQWSMLAAVKNHHLFYFPADLLQRPGPRILQGVEQLCAALNF